MAVGAICVYTMITDRGLEENPLMYDNDEKIFLNFYLIYSFIDMEVFYYR